MIDWASYSQRNPFTGKVFWFLLKYLDCCLLRTNSILSTSAAFSMSFFIFRVFVHVSHQSLVRFAFQSAKFLHQIGSLTISPRFQRASMHGSLRNVRITFLTDPLKFQLYKKSDNTVAERTKGSFVRYSLYHPTCFLSGLVLAVHLQTVLLVTHVKLLNKVG